MFRDVFLRGRKQGTTSKNVCSAETFAETELKTILAHASDEWKGVIGHDSEAISRHYTHIETKAKRAALQKLPKLI